MPYRFASCNEVFQNHPFKEACSQIHEAGYTGIEIAPFTLGLDPEALTQSERVIIRNNIREASLEFVGLHWLLAAPAGLHATTRDETVRNRTWTYVDRFVDLCADLANSTDGKNGIVVFGSPKQRSAGDGMTPKEATALYIDGLAKAAPHAKERGVTILVEALSPDQSDVVTSLGEAVSIVKQIGSPAVQTMFDVHNAIDEKVPHLELIRDFFPYIKHIHVNELNGKEPGTGDYDFPALLKCLTNLNYQGWVSLEAFDFTSDPREIVTRSINYLRASASVMA